MLLSLRTGLALEKAMCDAHGFPVLAKSPQERMRSLLAYRNDRRLFKRVCSMSGEEMISAYHKDAPFPVIKSSLWWGDEWDAMGCGFVPDTEKSFFAQFALLQSKVPREGTSVVNSENCEYNSHTRDSKNGYLNHLSANSENVLYSHLMISCLDCVDCISSIECTLCFDCGYLKQCYECVGSEELSNCTDCYFSYQLRGCKNCIFCTNLIGKEFYYRNTPCTPEEFAKIKSSILNGELETYETAKLDYQAMKASSPQRATHILNCEDVIGEDIADSKNCVQCFHIRNSQDCFNLWNGGSSDVVHGYSILLPPSQTVYSCVTIRGCKNIFFSTNCWNSNDLWYSDNCVHCSDCFGCVGLKKKKHCFFNVQYSPDEYRKLFDTWRETMIKHHEWGEFFPMEHSPFCYNESAAQDFFPLSKEQILKEGLRFREFDDVFTRQSGSMSKASEPPKELSHLSEGILSCPECHLWYRIIPQEIEFYRKMQLPPPQECPGCRLTKRIQERCPYFLILRQCSGCSRDIETVFTQEKNPQVFCEECYVEQCV